MPSPQIPQLDDSQYWAFLAEIRSSQNLLGYGSKVLREARFIETTLDPIMTMLSIGVEKLLKLNMGVARVARDEPWPTKAEMRVHGHGILRLYETVLEEATPGVQSSTPYVRGLFEAVLEDPVLPPLLAVLDRYGSYGRFYNLDRLGDSPQAGDSPTEMWAAAENATLASPRVAALQRASEADIMSNEAADAFYRGVQSQVADSLRGLWFALHRAGMNGVFGSPGRLFGSLIDPDAVGHQ